MTFIQNGADIIQNKIDSALTEGTHTAYITGNYEIEKTVTIPSDFYLVLENCHLRMADGTFCNMFTNRNCRTDIGRKAEGTDYNITIEGRGRVILDGGNYNGLSEKTSCKDGNPHISANNVILFTNVEGFKISGLHIRNQRWWAMNFIYCRNGRIRDIDFLADYTRIDENGNRIPYLGGEEQYSQIYIKNADGINLRAGCRDIIIENITGFCEDDTVAVNGQDEKLETEYFYTEGLSRDIHNIIIRNINASSFCSLVRVLNGGGVKVYNVLVDGVFDSSKDSKYFSRGVIGVRVGDAHQYGSRFPTADECYNICIRNIYSRAKTVLKVVGEMRDCRFENVNGFDGYEQLVYNDSPIDVEKMLKG